jgi:hypothetical protein
MRKTVLLLTATIDPGDTVMVARRDPAVRLADYQHALRRWITSGVACDMVVCENSGSDLTSLREIAKGFFGNVEFVSYSGNASGAIRGKGHAEMEMIRHVLGASKLLAGAEIILKCTGRLAVRNAAKILQGTSRGDFDVMCTLKRNLSFADSRLFAATPRFINEYLLPLGEKLDDNRGMTFEHGLAQATARAISDQRRWSPFPCFPVIDGVSGTDGKSMTNSALTRVSKAVYHQLRNVVYRH